jgi:hypothetical protein
VSKYHSAAGRYREALEASGAPRVCSYTDRQDNPTWGPCGNLGGRTGPLVLEAGHVIELADGGPADLTVWQCQLHNRKQADYARARRKEAQRRGHVVKVKPEDIRPVGARGKTAKPSRRGPIVRAACIVIASLAVLWWFRFLDPLMGPLVHVGLPCTLLAVIGWCFWYVRGHARRRARQRVQDLAIALARTMGNLLPDALRIEPARSGAWGPHGQLLRGGMVYPGWVITTPGNKLSVVDPVEQLLTHLAGEPLRFVWTPAAHRVDWAPGPPVRAVVDPAATEEAAAESTGVPAGMVDSIQALTKSPEATVKVMRRDADGPVEVVIRYGSKFQDHSDDARANLLDLVATKTSVRWMPDWQYARNTLVLTRHPDMPAMIYNPVTPFHELNPRRCDLGQAVDGQPRWWDRAVAPHLLIAGETGGGKTVVFHTVAYWASAMGWEIVLIDGKGSALAGLRHLPGVTKVGLADGEKMHDALMYADGEMRRRYDQVLHGQATFWDFRPMIVLFDEKTEAMKQIQAWWDVERQADRSLPRQAPSNDVDGSIARLGREGGVHLVLAMQQAAARYFADATEARGNFGCRLALGATTRESAQMMFGRVDIGRDIPATAKGRATLVVGTGTSGKAVEVQTYWTPLTLPSGATKPRTDDDPEPHPDDVRMTAQLAERAKAGYAHHVAQHAERRAKGIQTPSDDAPPMPEGTLIGEPPAPRQRTATATKARVLTLVELAAAAQAEVPRWVIVDGEAVQVVEVVEDPTDDGYAQLTLRDARATERTVSVPDTEVFEEADPEA